MVFVLSFAMRISQYFHDYYSVKGFSDNLDNQSTKYADFNYSDCYLCEFGRPPRNCGCSRLPPFRIAFASYWHGLFDKQHPEDIWKLQKKGKVLFNIFLSALNEPLIFIGN